MTPERWHEVERICEGALACAPAERSAFVAAACGGDDALRREVESLLANADSAERFIEEPAIAVAGALAGLSGLSVGQRLGPYHIVGKIGAGGMGEVYRAHDTQLGRDVAVKIVPPVFASDAERLARFEREARLLASLNHPHIASIYGIQAEVGDDGRPVRALVMELVEGPTLAERIAQKPVPLVEALPIARQIAEALAAAHEKGIVHRDLKPANIKLTADGAVKVLDFGLAKAASAVTGEADLSHSPTLTAGGTQAGILLGTAAYMSPEQARGQEVDRRTDIWAFGCVLYEMLSGTCAFDGETAGESLGAVIHKHVDYDRLPANLPQSIHIVLRRCLQKDPKERLRDMGDVRLALDGAFVPEVPADRTERRGRRRGLELVAAACLAAMGGAAAVWWLQDATPPDRRSIRFEIPVPASTQGLAMSPDGRHVAYIARDAAGTNWLHVRSLETGDTRQIAQTDRPAIWSPNSLAIAFAAEGKLKRIDLAGGRALTLCDVGNFVGGSWTSGDVILFADLSKGGILQVPATGGTPVARAIVNPQRDRSAPNSPWALPDGRHFLYRRGGITPDKTGIYVGRLDVPPERQDLTLLLRSDTGAAYVPPTNSGPGHLLFIQGGVLNARAFDAESLELGDPLANVAEGVTTFGVSARGDVAYANFNRSGGGTLVWVDRTGNAQSAITTRPVQNPRLSPDGRSVAVVIEHQVWRYDLDGRPPLRLASDGLSPMWTPDGSHVIYEARSGLASVLADGSSEMPEPASPSGHFHPHGWTSDGKIVALRWDFPKGLKDLVRFSPKSSGQIEAVLATPADEGHSAALSPDGRWLAYVSNETGSDEIWLRSASDSGASVRVSPSGGTDPVWARNGRELFYIAGTDLMAVPVNLRNPFQYERPVRLFDVASYPRSEQPPSYDVSENGRFLMARTDSPFTNSITVILDWTARLRSTAPH